MSDETLSRVRQNCCRLCLAPDTECISILNSYAADKEPLVTKIQNCVGIKITSYDRLSLRICHACISYLNSWQSFKNRCLTSQKKQRSWVDNNLSITTTPADNTQDEYQEQSSLASSILDGITTLKKRKSLTVYPLPAVQIKEEPTDNDDDYSMKHHDESDDIVDPTMFLERTQEEEEEPIMEPPHYSFSSDQPSVISDVKEASCRACNLKFSTRANARRHERNLHPNLFEFGPASANSTPITRPTAALAAALELRRTNQNSNAADTSSLLSQQKYRQLVVNAFNQGEAGGYDYDSPEKYQQLLTDEKIVFLQQNEDFLSQYQNMTCRCCNRSYTTYKNFMAHMRKKYATLPRNLCFNCLKLNDSKAHFISHLKRRNCINLYRILHSLMLKDQTFAAAVKATSAAVPEKLRAKELLVNKMYECKLCSKSFRLKLEFRTHVYDDHADAQKRDTGSKQCSFCSVELEDPAERKRHNNNMDCIASLRCVTCDAKFDKHQQFLDHVYEKHLAGFGEQNNAQPQVISGLENVPAKKSITGSITEDSRGGNQPKTQYFSRMPQACPICGQQYNNYNNVLRHMESKHPDQLPQTYKCVKCGTGFPRLSNLREHMINAHAAESIKHTGFEYIVNADAVKISGEDGENEQAAKKIRLDTSVNIKNNGTPDNKVYNSSKECPICNAVFSNNIGLSNHMRSHTAAAQNAAAAANSAKNAQRPLSITAAPKTNATAAQNTQGVREQAIFRRSLEQAADRRFRRMRCRICQRRFSSKKSYRFHMLNDHQIRNVQFIKCKICEAEFAYEKGLKVHMFKIHHTLLRNEMIVKQYECDICSIVYPAEEQLLQHKRTVHGNENAQSTDFADGAVGDTSSLGADHSGISTPVSGASIAGGERNTTDQAAAAPTGPLYWYQCKYCPSNFNTNKKLAIHINSHDEFDSKDYSCKDCGNVYSGRKSLWVHRYKKHPQIAQPSECTMCRKVFFDSQMLENHIPTCNRIQVPGTVDSLNTPVYRHKTGDDEDISREGADLSTTIGTGNDEVSTMTTGKIRLPEVACTICGQRFTDQELFTKHIQMHEQELYTDNPLAAMFDTGPADPNQFYLDRVNDNGEYACDLCQKTFTQMTALKVHRKWHFRGDSKQNQVESDANTLQTQTNHPHLLGLQAVGLMPNPRPSSKSQKHKRELKCEYCSSTFISNNNLRRHIYELHKDEISNLPQPPKIETDKYLHCRRCDFKFSTKFDWIEHKLSEARVMKPYGPFQWGCDLCGAYVSRKEKLIHHISNHLKESVIVPIEQQKQEMKNQKNQNADEENAHHSDNDKHLDNSEYGQEEESMENDIEQDEQAESDDDDNETTEEGDPDGDEDDNGSVREYDEEMDENNGNNENNSDDDDDDEDDDEDVQTDHDYVIQNEEVDKNNRNSQQLAPKLIIKTNRTVDDTTEAEDSPSYIDDDDDEDEDGDGDGDGDGDRDGDGDGEGDGDVDHDGDGDAMDTDSDDSSSSIGETNTNKSKSHSCDLCQVYFESQQELQKHVKTHFLNGPITFGAVNSRPKNASRSSTSSDAYEMSS
ncbi:zinc finger protein hangover isoform X2 [Teleopsis dalmanni]|uniref:zinc finger protein hangover isoform X2 n=1 Tax=Teleopsis dalmanni TaxID=139649 RepID=UPI0018CD47D6|nr:zinc finger protein hangover isoform X2 [Teleopsis dalmanni]